MLDTLIEEVNKVKLTIVNYSSMNTLPSMNAMLRYEALSQKVDLLEKKFIGVPSSYQVALDTAENLDAI